MNKILTILLILISYFSYGQLKYDDLFNSKNIISTDFQDSDSVVFRLEITQGKDILVDSERSFLTIFILPKMSYLIYQPSKGETQQYIASREQLIKAMIDFEKNAKSDNLKRCENEPEKIYASIKLNIGTKYSNFGYCVSYWDGINEMIESIKN